MTDLLYVAMMVAPAVITGGNVVAIVITLLSLAVLLAISTPLLGNSMARFYGGRMISTLPCRRRHGFGRPTG